MGIAKIFGAIRSHQEALIRQREPLSHNLVDSCAKTIATKGKEDIFFIFINDEQCHKADVLVLSRILALWFAPVLLLIIVCAP